jgi:hypothetical protein
LYPNDICFYLGITAVKNDNLPSHTSRAYALL